MSGHCLRGWTRGPLGLIVALTLFAIRPSAAPAGTEQVRGLWVLRSSLTSVRSIQHMVDTAQRAGFNTLLVQVRGRGDAYYASRVEPRASELEDEPDTFDPLALTLATAHAAGLKVHAWVNVDLVASATTLPRASAHVIARHPEWLMVPRAIANALRHEPPDTPAYLGQIARAVRAQGDRVEGLYLSPVLAASRNYTASVIHDLASRYDLDGVHLDYLRYPNDQFDYSAQTIAAFRAEVLDSITKDARARLDRLALTSVTAWPDALPGPWAQFRRDRLTLLAATLRATAIAARRGIIVSVAVAPNADDARESRLQDWRQWARTKIVDALCPMIYTPDAAEFANLVARVKTDAGTADVWAGIGAFKLSPARTTENLRAVRKAGVAGVLLYSYDSLSASDAPPNYFSIIRSALLDQSQNPIGR